MAAEVDTRRMVTALFNSIPATELADPTSNPLRDLPPEAKNTFLTLYALFEKEVLPALDLLDRGLVTRLRTSTSEERVQTKLYLIRSSQPQTTRNPQPSHINSYSVHLNAWTCSCPAFTFSAFPAAAANNESETSETPPRVNSGLKEGSQWLFGGLTLGSEMPPICKHLLACVLIEHISIFSSFLDERDVSVEEIAGWAAGWGD